MDAHSDMETQPLLGGPNKEAVKRVAIIAAVVALVVGIIVGLIVGWGVFSASEVQHEKVGVLHSLTGPLALDERHVVDATLLAINEINAAGGLLGKKLQPVLRDGFSDQRVFASEMQRLLAEEKTSVVFGCWTSESRKAVLPALTSNNGLLFYPVQYEGVENHPNVIYTGAAPNQQILPALNWAYSQGYRKFALLGSDYIFPRTAHAIIRNALSTMSGVQVNEQYLILGEENPTRVSQAVANIAAFQPDVIFNTVNGDTNILLFNALSAANVNTPMISLSIAEFDIAQISSSGVSASGSYASWNYFQSVSNDANTAFVSQFKKTYGQASVIGDPMAAAYTGVKLWAAAVQMAKTFEVSAVKEALKSVSVDSPMGTVSVAPNQHTVKPWYLGRVQSSGQFSIVASSSGTVAPEPYPLAGAQRTQDAWNTFLNCWYSKWGNSWKNTAGPSAILPNDTC